MSVVISEAGDISKLVLSTVDHLQDLGDSLSFFVAICFDHP